MLRIYFFLGMMPFVRELLRGGTKVTMCANTHPALNDVTYSELEVRISNRFKKIYVSWRNKQESIND